MMDDAKKMAAIAVDALEDKKGENTTIIDIGELTALADYFIIANGHNRNQVQAMADNVEEMLGKAGYEPKSIEGYKSAGWILLDYRDVVIHIFSEEDRDFYDLERIWRDGRKISREELDL